MSRLPQSVMPFGEVARIDAVALQDFAGFEPHFPNARLAVLSRALEEHAVAKDQALGEGVRVVRIRIHDGIAVHRRALRRCVRQPAIAIATTTRITTSDGSARSLALCSGPDSRSSSSVSGCAPGGTSTRNAAGRQIDIGLELREARRQVHVDRLRVRTRSRTDCRKARLPDGVFESASHRAARRAAPTATCAAGRARAPPCRSIDAHPFGVHAGRRSASGSGTTQPVRIACRSAGREVDADQRIENRLRRLTAQHARRRAAAAARRCRPAPRG